MQHTDIITNNWIDRRLPRWARPYARLARLDRPIGTWLLVLPCWWGVALASPVLPDIWLMVLFGIGAIIMRGAGCVINDIYDRDFDRQVERTRTRPLASGDLSLWQAIIFLAVLLLLGLGILLLLNRFTVWLGFSSLLLVVTYPLAKRITWWPQLVLGLAFNWGAIMGWSAVHDSVGLPALLLYAAGIFWTLGYDTIYAHQDKIDDAMIGVKSLALKLGDQSRLWVSGFYATALVLLLLTGAAAGLSRFFYGTLVFAVLHAGWHIATWHIDDPANCLQRFRNNRDFGILVLIAILLGKLL